MSREPKWFAEAARLLAEGRSQKETAKLLGVARETIVRRLNAPGSALAAEVERRRAALAADNADETKSLLDRAMAALKDDLTSSDPRRRQEATKIVIGKMLPSQSVVKVEESTAAAPVSAEDATRELARALTVAADLIAAGDVSHEAIALLSEAAARLVAVLPKGGMVPPMALPVSAAAAESPALPTHSSVPPPAPAAVPAAEQVTQVQNENTAAAAQRPPLDPRVLGARLRAARLATGATLQSAARSLGMDAGALARAEAGEEVPEVATLDAMAKFYALAPHPTRGPLGALLAPPPKLSPVGA